MSKPKIKIVLFDVDGVLLDSLTPHLKICEDKSKEYGLDLAIPDASEFKGMVRRGILISPMKYFFLAVGFPEELAERANLEYQKIFMEKYAPAPFPCVNRTLSKLHDAGFKMGIVTSNVMANVVEALGENMNYFHPECIYSKDNMSGASKSDAIISSMNKLEASPAETIYVGDQPADWKEAQKAGVNFLGVSYGWGISDADEPFETVGKVSDIYQYILKLSNSESNIGMTA